MSAENPLHMGMETIHPTCPVCGGPMTRGRRGPARETCSAACRSALFRSRHPDVVILFMSDLLADRLPAEPNTSRGDDHRAVIESIKDYVETVISIAVENEDSGRVQDILDRLREAMAPYNRRLARGRTARQSDIPKVVRKVHSIYDPLGVDQ